MMNSNFISRYASFHNLSLPAAESAIIAALTDVSHNLAPRFAFASHTIEDIFQEAFLHGLTLIEKDQGAYNPARPLTGYLAVSIKNHLHNFKRQHFFRAEPPCSCCNPFDPPENPCARWKTWFQLNHRKRMLAGSESGDFETTKASSPSDNAELFKQIDQFVDECFAPRLRADYLRLKAGVALPPSRKKAVVEAIRAKFGGSALER